MPSSSSSSSSSRNLLYTAHFPNDYASDKRQSLEMLLKELNSPKMRKDYAFSANNDNKKQARNQLRYKLREFFGLEKKRSYEAGASLARQRISLAGILAPKNEESVGKDLYIAKTGEISTQKTDRRDCVMSAHSLRNNQKKVKVYFNQGKMKSRDVADVQAYKMNKGMGRERKKALNYIAVNMCVRAPVNQHFRTELDDNGGALRLEQALEVVQYYGCNPNFSKGKDLDTYCRFDDKGKAQIKDQRGVKNRFKNTLHMLLSVAHQHKEAVDVVTPGAFLQGLTKADQGLAKRLFIEAAFELAGDEKYAGCQGLFLHSGVVGQNTSVHKFIAGKDPQSKLKIPLIISGGDILSPQRAVNALKAKGQSININVSVFTAGHPTAPVGNGAWSDYANYAVEEGLARMCFDMVLVLSPFYNKSLLNEKRYIAIDARDPQSYKKKRNTMAGNRNCLWRLIDCLVPCSKASIEKEETISLLH